MWQGWLATKLQEAAHIQLSSAGTAQVYHHTQPFLMGSGDWTQVLMSEPFTNWTISLGHQHLYQLGQVQVQSSFLRNGTLRAPGTIAFATAAAALAGGEKHPLQIHLDFPYGLNLSYTALWSELGSLVG